MTKPAPSPMADTRAVKTKKHPKINSYWWEGYNQGKADTEKRIKHEIENRVRMLLWGNIIIGGSDDD